MITVGMNYEVLAGKEQDFETVFAKVLEVMKAMAGHGESHLYKDVWKSNSYLIVSEWTDEGAFDSFTQSERFKSVVDWGKEKILASRPKHEIYGRQARQGSSCPAGAH